MPWRLTVRTNSDGANVKVSFTDIGSDIIFDIEDNGNGIPQEWHDMIFIQGFTTKEGENHGLGLAIVKNALKKWTGRFLFLPVIQAELNSPLFYQKANKRGLR